VDARRGERLAVGLVRGLHGLRGAVRVEVLSDDPARFAVGSVLHPEGAPDALTVAWSHADGPGLLVRFQEVTDRAAAEGLRDRYLEVVAGAPLPEGEYYWHEVEGATVTSLAGEVLGTVHEVFRAGSAEVFVVRGGRRGEVLVPAVSAVVAELAPREGRIVVDADALGLDEEPAGRRPRGRRTRRAFLAAAAAAAGDDARPTGTASRSDDDPDPREGTSDSAAGSDARRGDESPGPRS
jgi:16S rRNA processing protein RimM